MARIYKKEDARRRPSVLGANIQVRLREMRRTQSDLVRLLADQGFPADRKFVHDLLYGANVGAHEDELRAICKYVGFEYAKESE